MPHDIFISYSQKDKAVADAACDALEAAGMRCWIAPRDIPPGTSDWPTAITEAIDHCRLMVLIFSSGANASPDVQREVHRAFSNGITVIPFRVESIKPTQSLGYYLDRVQWLDALTPPLEKHLQHLVDTSAAHLSVQPVTTKIAPHWRFRATPPRIVIGLVAFVFIAAAVLYWTTRLPSPQDTIPPTPSQSVLTDLLRASKVEGLSPGIGHDPITLHQLHQWIVDGYPRELLFWLFTDSFDWTIPGGTQGLFGFHYNPPDDLGCDLQDPKHRCFADWVHIAALQGLTVEEKIQQTQDGRKSTFARFCFDYILAKQAAQLAPSFVPITDRDEDVIPSEIYSGPLQCGSPMWHPEVDPTKPYQEDTITFNFRQGTIGLRVVPRSPFGIFEFLGTLIGLERKGYKPAPYPPVDQSHYPSLRPWVGNIPPVLATANSDPIISIAEVKPNIPCYVQTAYKGIEYCVPEQSATTKRVFEILGNLANVPGPTPISKSQ